MEYLIIGGDERFAQLARLLRDRGDGVRTLWRDGAGEERGQAERLLAMAENIVVNYPPKVGGDGMTFEELLSSAAPDARVYACGPWRPAGDGRVVDLWADETLLLENAALTAEGAVAAAMRASTLALRDARCLVIGWGRIGRALTELLVGLGARTAVASRSAPGRNRAVERGAEGVDTGDLAGALADRDLIINTAPAMMLDAAALWRVNREAMLIDLASPPYGIDLHAAWGLGLRAWREPGLPGRYCPRSAAKALLEAIERHQREGGTRHD